MVTKKSKAWNCVSFSLLGALVSIFEDIESLWDRVCYLSSFWALVSSLFKGIPFFVIFIDLRAECDM